MLNTPRNQITVTFSVLETHLLDDPFYGVKSAATDEIINYIYRKYAGIQSMEAFRRSYLTGVRQGFKRRQLVHLWCVMGLIAYRNNTPLNWQPDDFLNHWYQDFDLKLDDIKTFLRLHKWPLPVQLFPDDVDNTRNKINREKAEFDRAFDDFVTRLPTLERELAELSAATAPTTPEIRFKRDETARLEAEISAILKGKTLAGASSPATQPSKFERELVSPSPLNEFRVMERLTADEVSIAFSGDISEDGIGANNMLEISARGETKRVALAVLGLVDRRTGRLNSQGVILLGMAKKLPLPSSTNKNRKKISRLRALIKSSLGTCDDPFEFRSAAKCWEPRFKIADNRGMADERAQREAERKTVSIEGMRGPSSEFESDPAKEWLEENDTELQS